MIISLASRSKLSLFSLTSMHSSVFVCEWLLRSGHGEFSGVASWTDQLQDGAAAAGSPSSPPSVCATGLFACCLAPVSVFSKRFIGFPETAQDSSTRDLCEDNTFFFFFWPTQPQICFSGIKTNRFLFHFHSFWSPLLFILLAIVIPSLRLYPTVTLAGIHRWSHQIRITTSCVSLVPLFLLLMSTSSLPSIFPSFPTAHQQSLFPCAAFHRPAASSASLPPSSPQPPLLSPLRRCRFISLCLRLSVSFRGKALGDWQRGSAAPRNGGWGREGVGG